MKLSGFLPDVDGETVLKAISLLAEDVPKDADTGLYPPIDQRCADALVDLASNHLAREQERLGERAFVVTHVELRADGSITGAELEGGIVIAPETAERLMCDALVEAVVHGHHGNELPATNGIRPLGAGRRSRRPSGRLRREIDRRDVWCPFPGCTRSRLGQAHHIKWWENNGETEPENLSLLCRYHHRLMHEGGWSMRGDPYGVLEFIKPNGEVLQSLMPEVSGELRKRIVGPALPAVEKSERGP